MSTKTPLTCDYCEQPLDPKIKQGKGHPDDWARDNDGAYHWRCIPPAETKADADKRRRRRASGVVQPMTGPTGGIRFYKTRYGGTGPIERG
jgi:hypothetical protein